MLTIRALKTQGGSKGGSGIPEYLTATHYYQNADGKEVVASAWFGAGAQALGLHRKAVDVEDMAKLAQGLAPDGTKLRRNAGEKPAMIELKDRQGNTRLDADGNPLVREVAQRIGWDMTFSAPKTVSVAFAAADGELRDQILEAHHRAVAKSLSWIEQHAAETRRGKAGRDVHDAGMVISRHTHFAARPHDQSYDGSESQCDPDLHSHCVAYNVALAEGKFGSLETCEIYRQKLAVGALYRAELAAGLAKLGFGIEDEIHYDDSGKEKFRAFKIAGIPDELAEEMSGRRGQIEQAMKSDPSLSPQAANLKTRQAKDEPPFEELTKRWKAHLDSFRMRHPELGMPADAEALRQGERKPVERDQAREDAEILAKLHATKTVWTRHDLLQQIAERNAGTLDATGVAKACNAFVKRNDLHVIQPEKVHDDERGEHLARRHRQVRYASQAVVQEEKDMVASVRARATEDHSVAPAMVTQAISQMEKARGFQLSPEQRKAVEHLTQAPGAVQSLVGRAGTGKTTVSEAVVASHRAVGYSVIGAATGWDAAKKLEAEAGIPSHSIAALLKGLDDGKLKLTAKTLIVVDEAGMVGTPSMSALLKHAEKAKTKVILQGDPLQLQSVERGGAMRAITKAVGGGATLADIRRQKHAEDTKTAGRFYAVGGDELRSRGENAAAGREILARMEKRGQIRAFDDDAEAMRALVADYLGSSTGATEKLIIAGKRADVAALNDAVRQGLHARGRLGPDHTIQVAYGTEGKTRSMPLAVGDQVRFGAKDKKLGLVNGSRARIDAIEPLQGGGHRIEATLISDIKRDNGRKIAFDTREFSAIAHGYASTVHKSQGQSKTEVYHYAGENAAGVSDRQLALVAFTRMKQSYQLYGTVDGIYGPALDANVVTDHLQMNALEEGLTGRTTKRPEVAEPPKQATPDPLFQRVASAFKDAWQRVHNPAPKQQKQQQRRAAVL